MEYGLGQYDNTSKNSLFKRLNPCFNGIWSRTTTQNIKVKFI